MNEQNLKPFRPGQCGNPKGRPKKLPELEKICAKVLGAKSGESKISAMEQIIKGLVKVAKKGDTRAAQLVMDRAYGKVKESLKIDSDNKHTFEVNVNFKKDE